MSEGTPEEPDLQPYTPTPAALHDYNQFFTLTYTAKPVSAVLPSCDPFAAPAETNSFFDNSVCVCCKKEVGWCPQCNAIADVTTDVDGKITCSCCKSRLVKCTNYAEHNVCNRFLVRNGSDGINSGVNLYCDCCRFNRTIPDLSVEGNRAKWYRLEAAKRRTLYDLDMVGFPYGTEKDGIVPRLAFEFKGDVIPDKVYRGMGPAQKVFTGHDNGVITINIQEADDVEREKLRVNMGEPSGPCWAIFVMSSAIISGTC